MQVKFTQNRIVWTTRNLKFFLQKQKQKQKQNKNKNKTKKKTQKTKTKTVCFKPFYVSFLFVLENYIKKDNHL